MPNYLYKIKDEHGKNLYGFWEAADIRELKVRLRNFGHYFVSAKPYDLKVLSNKTVTFDALLMFTHRLTSLIESGIPILSAFNILWRQTEEKNMQLVISRIYRYIEDGNNISNALNEFPKIFPFLYRSLVKVAEKTGSLVFILRQIVAYLEYQRQFTTRIKKAMMYPMIVMVLTVLILIGMFTFVVPTFQKVLVGLKVELPLITRIVLALSQLMLNKFFIVFALAALAATVYLLNEARKVPKFAFLVDKYMLSIPYFGSLFFTMTLSRFLHSLKVLIGSGLPIVESLDVAKSTISNQYMLRYIDQVQEGVRQGRSLYETFRDARIFPILFVEMLGVGETVGSVTKVLENLTKHFDEEVDYKLNKFLTIIDPVLIVIVGTIVLITMLAVYMPIFSIWNKLAG